MSMLSDILKSNAPYGDSQSFEQSQQFLRFHVSRSLRQVAKCLREDLPLAVRFFLSLQAYAAIRCVVLRYRSLVGSLRRLRTSLASPEKPPA